MVIDSTYLRQLTRKLERTAQGSLRAIRTVLWWWYMKEDSLLSMSAEYQPDLSSGYSLPVD
jgi:hypothetical protein